MEELRRLDYEELLEHAYELELLVGLRHKRALIKRFDREYDLEDKLKNPNRNYAGIMPDAEEVYKRYYSLLEENKILKETITNQPVSIPFIRQVEEMFPTNDFKITTTCDGCPSNPKNGGNGLCWCTMGQKTFY